MFLFFRQQFNHLLKVQSCERAWTNGVCGVPEFSDVKMTISGQLKCQKLIEGLQSKHTSEMDMVQELQSRLQAAGKSQQDWVSGELPLSHSSSFARQLKGHMLSHDLTLHTMTRREFCLLLFAQISLCSLWSVLPLEPLMLLIGLRQNGQQSGACVGIFLFLVKGSSLDDQGMKSDLWNQGLCQLGKAVIQHNGHLPVSVVHAIKHIPSSWTQTAEWEVLPSGSSHGNRRHGSARKSLSYNMVRTWVGVSKRIS